MAQFTFFTDLEKNIDDMVVTIVNSISDNALTYFLPVVQTGLSISLLWFSLMIFLGNYDNPVNDWIKKLTVIAIVVFVAGAGVISTGVGKYYLRLTIRVSICTD